MATERLSMRHTREILRQRYTLGRSHRAIAQSLSVSHGAVGATVGRAQAAGVAVLIEGDPGLVRMLGVDGLHVEGGVNEVKAATSALKPDFIVGAGQIASRHDAMSKGELGPDYIFFGPLSGARDPEQREMARWWAEIMDVPSVLSDPAATAETATSEGAEFIALSDSLWSAPEGVTARLGAIAKALEAKP